MEEAELLAEVRRHRSVRRPMRREDGEEVTALKQELNLAARVGQSLLDQIQWMESRLDEQQRHSGTRLEVLYSENTRLRRENSELLREHEDALQALAEQQGEIRTLTAQLKTSQARADRLSRAAARAEALENEVQMLEEMHEVLQRELATPATSKVSGVGRMAAQIGTQAALLESQLQLETPRRPPTTELLTPDQTIASESGWSDDTLWSGRPPPLTRSRSHESVLSILQTPEPTSRVAPPTPLPLWWDSPVQSRAGAVSGLTHDNVLVSPAGGSKNKTSTPARDQLLSFQASKQSTPQRAQAHQPHQPQQWSFVPFRRK